MARRWPHPVDVSNRLERTRVWRGDGRIAIGREHMGRGNDLADRLVGHGREGVAVRKRCAAARRGAQHCAFQVGLDVSEQDGRISRLEGVQRPHLGGVINLPQVVDAGVGLGGGAGSNDVRNGNRREEADQADDDHELNQRESPSARRWHPHQSYISSAGAHGLAWGRFSAGEASSPTDCRRLHQRDFSSLDAILRGEKAPACTRPRPHSADSPA